MYWCNCTESWTATGRKLAKSYLKRGFVTFHQVETNGDVCVHCGHTAFYSKSDPNEVQIQVQASHD